MTFKDIRYSFYVLTHPFDGFWDLKYEKRGKLSIALLFMGLWFIANIYQHIGMSFLLNSNYGVPLNIFAELRSVLMLFALFCIGNWSVTTLMDGKGYFKDIVITFGYACLPLTIIRVPLIFLSQIAIPNEAIYIQFGLGLSWAWFFLLLFIGMMMIHDYTLVKAVGTMILTICSMLILIFILMVFYNIFSQLYSFVLAVIKELRLRI